MEKKTIGKFISVLRRAAGMTQKELGERLFVSDKTVSRWERDECTPELALIPVIAEIFGVTTDELLRGERNSPAGEDRPHVSGEEPEAAARSAERQKKKSDRQWAHMLHRRMTMYRNLSFISIGLAVLGLLGAVICNLGFYRGLIGFCVSAVFVLAAVICQLCFTANARMTEELGDCDEDTDRLADLRAFNTRVTRWALWVLALAATVLAFCLPITQYNLAGLTGWTWLFLGAMTAGITLVVIWLLYEFFICGLLVRRGLLHMQDGWQDRAKVWHRCIRNHLLAAGAVAAVLGLGINIIGSLHSTAFSTPIVFNDYDSFAAFMADAAANDGFNSTVIYDEVHVSVPTDKPGQEADDLYGAYDGEILYDDDGTELCRYPWAAGVVLQFSPFEGEGNGLPVKVYTSSALADGHAIREGIQTVLGVLIAVDAVVCAGALVRRRRKLTEL